VTLKILLGKLWNCPNTLLGLLGAIGGTPQNSPDPSGVLEVSGGWLIRVLARGGWASAITLGEVVLYEDAALILVLHTHEMVHVRQGRLWGPFFLPAYVLESLYQWLKTGDGYRNNRFEVEAFRAED
jgi:hypothetical protein